MLLEELLDPELLEQMVAEGYISRRLHPDHPLVILNYTDKCTYDRKWNDVTRRCRGLIYDTRTRKVLARPFEKIFNHNEPDAPKIPRRAQAIRVADKIDGSLGILYYIPSYELYPARQNDGWRIATRGSFTSDQALHASVLFAIEYVNRWTELNQLGTDQWTHLFEIVYPGNRVVVDYGDLDDLIYLGSIHIETGKWFEFQGFPGPYTETFDFDTFEDVLNAPPRKGKEGYVVESTFGWVKVKQPDYVELHRIIFGLNARVVWEKLKNSDDWAVFVASLPEEFLQWASDTRKSLTTSYQHLKDGVYDDYNNIIDELPAAFSRKDFALKAQKCVHPSPLFSLLDGRGDRVEEWAWKMVYPSADWSPRASREEVE